MHPRLFKPLYLHESESETYFLVLNTFNSSLFKALASFDKRVVGSVLCESANIREIKLVGDYIKCLVLRSTYDTKKLTESCKISFSCSFKASFWMFSTKILRTSIVPVIKMVSATLPVSYFAVYSMFFSSSSDKFCSPSTSSLSLISLLSLIRFDLKLVKNEENRN